MSGNMNPFGIFSVLEASMDAVGEAFGRKRKRESRRERFWFIFFSLLLLLASVAAICLTVRQLYLQ